MVRLAAFFTLYFGAVLAAANPAVDFSAFSLVRRADNVTGTLPTDNNTSGIPFDSSDCKADSTCAPYFATTCSDTDYKCNCAQSRVQAFAYCMECGISKNDTDVNEAAGLIVVKAYQEVCTENGNAVPSIQFGGLTLTSGAVTASLGLGVISAAAGVFALLL
ncbi:hypothetical protein BDQ17DRAFT_1409441 [Cyathus striatus]|nr:hypothetical protein BDQ17DRAFT_1409441 [Cyathus striatus]